MRRFVILLACIGAAALGGCSMDVHTLKPTPGVMHEIGLPLYPHSTTRYAMRVSQGVQGHHIDSLIATLETRDDLDTVDRFYQKHLPNYAQRVAIPLGPVRTIQYTFYSALGQEQVQLQHIQDVTVIRLQLLRLTSPSPSPTAS